MKIKKKKLPLQILAARKADREQEQEFLGEGLHARTRVVKSKKLYSRKAKHKGREE